MTKWRERFGRGAADLKIILSVEERDHERRRRELRGVHQGDVAAKIGVVAEARDEHLVESGSRCVGRCEAVPRQSREKLSGRGLGGAPALRRRKGRSAASRGWNRIHARLHADRPEIGASSLRRIALGTGTDGAVAASLAGIEDQLSESDGEAEAPLGHRRGHEVGNLPPLIRSKREERRSDRTKALKRSGRGTAVEN